MSMAEQKSKTEIDSDAAHADLVQAHDFLGMTIPGVYTASYAASVTHMSAAAAASNENRKYWQAQTLAELLEEEANERIRVEAEAAAVGKFFVEYMAAEAAVAAVAAINMPLQMHIELEEGDEEEHAQVSPIGLGPRLA
jgi:hypothetical protein